MAITKDLLVKNKPFGNAKETTKTSGPKDPLKRNGPPFMKMKESAVMDGMKRAMKKK